MPVAAEQLAAGRPGPHLRELTVLLFGQEHDSPLCGCVRLPCYPNCTLVADPRQHFWFGISSAPHERRIALPLARVEPPHRHLLTGAMRCPDRPALLLPSQRPL